MDDNPTATRYAIRVRGVMSERLLGAFPELLARRQDHETILTGVLPDQSALHGVLARIEALGLELLEVRRPRTNGGIAAHAAGAEPKRRHAADLLTQTGRPASADEGRNVPQ